jgi:hypothetical protein
VAGKIIDVEKEHKLVGADSLELPPCPAHRLCSWAVAKPTDIPTDSLSARDPGSVLS